MDSLWKTALWRQFGSAIDMLENALVACPGSLWRERLRRVTNDHPFLAATRQKCHAQLSTLADERARQAVDYPWTEGQDVSFLELHLYNMRHVQEHAAQLNMFLGQNGVSEASDWASRAKADEDSE